MTVQLEAKKDENNKKNKKNKNNLYGLTLTKLRK